MMDNNKVDKEGKYHIIYKTTNLINGKWYIGKHSTYNIDDGYLGSSHHLKYAIKKYGRENFIREILVFCDNEQEAYEKEAEIVTMEVVNDPNSYNKMPGGEGGQKRYTDDELKEHIRESQRKHYEANRERIIEHQLRYYEANRERIREYQREYQLKHYDDNRECILEYQREYYEANREKRLEYGREYYEDNREKRLEYQREYYEANRERIREYQREYRERKKNSKKLKIFPNL